MPESPSRDARDGPPCAARNDIDRRAALRGGAASAGVALAAPALIGPLAAQGLTKVRMILAWLPEGSYAYAFVARNKGLWRKRGLDVEIARGYGSFASAQAVAAGQFDFGMTNPASVVLLATKSIELTLIGLMDYESFMAVGLLKDSPIRVPADLVGKKVGQTLSSSDAVFFKVFAEKNGFDASKVVLSNVDAKIRNQSLASRQQDAVTGLVSSMLPSMATQGVDTRYLLYRDYGVNLYGNIGIACRSETTVKRPDVCRAFMDGLVEGLHDTLTRPEEAVDALFSEVPEMRLSAKAPDLIRLGMSVQRASVLTEQSVLERGLGWSDLAKLDATADLVMAYQAEPGARKPDVPAIVTNAFVSERKLSREDWDRAKQETEAILKTINGS